jgi:integrase
MRQKIDVFLCWLGIATASLACWGAIARGVMKFLSSALSLMNRGMPTILLVMVCANGAMAGKVTWVGYHEFRRGLATRLHDMGVDDLTIRRIMRHGDVDTTRRTYIKTLPEQVNQRYGTF